ncbi:MAG: hypothetical protein WBL25_17415 [Anaerolineales bacterium]
MSEAEVIRQALEHEAQTPAPAARGIRFVNPFSDTFDINEWV